MYFYLWPFQFFFKEFELSEFEWSCTHSGLMRVSSNILSQLSITLITLRIEN